MIRYSAPRGEATLAARASAGMCSDRSAPRPVSDHLCAPKSLLEGSRAGAYRSRAKTGRTRRQPTASSLTSAWRKPTFLAATSPPRAPATMIVQALELDRIHLGHRTHTVAPRITCDTAALSEKFHTISYLRGLNRTLRQDVRCRNGR